jgi:hypothetical protein
MEPVQALFQKLSLMIVKEKDKVLSMFPAPGQDGKIQMPKGIK